MKSNQSTIPVYQALSQPEKVTNQTARPDLVYSNLTTFELLLRQVKKEGIGIILSSNITSASAKKVFYKYPVQVIGELGVESVKELSSKTGIIVVTIKPGATIKVSDLQLLANEAGSQLKWISILQQPHAQQLFKWDLKFRGN